MEGWKSRYEILGPLTELTTADASVSQMDGMADLQNGASTVKENDVNRNSNKNRGTN